VENSQKSVCGRGSAPDPAGGAHDAPPDPPVGLGGGNPLPRPHPLGTSLLGAFGTSNLATPQFFLFPPNLGCLDKTLSIDLSRSESVVKLWGNAGERRSPLVFGGERRSSSLHNRCVNRGNFQSRNAFCNL